MTNWKETTLGELIRSGFVSNHNNKRAPLSSEVRSKMQGQYPYYGAASAIDFVNDYKFDGFYLLIAEDGTVFDGRAPMLQLVDGKFWVSNHSHVLQGEDKQATKLLYYVLKNVAISPYVTGAVQPKLTKENLYKISFSFPESSGEQKEIAGVLSSLDDKIELLREENKTLEATARAIFKEWFVNFNFPNIEGKPYKSSGGKMIDSELGEIPEGWQVGRLSDIAVFLNGLALQKYPPESNIEYLPVIKIKELNSGISEQTDKASARLDNKYIVENGDVLFSWSGSLIVDLWKHGRGALNQHLFRVTSDEFPKWFYFYWIKEHLPSFQQTAIAKAVTMGHIQRHHLDDALVSIPGEEFMKVANTVFAPMLEKFINNNSQIQNLSTFRDTLLPRLMNGEIVTNPF